MNKWIRRVKWQALMSGIVGTTLLMGVAFAQTSTLDLDLKDADLVSAVQALTNRTGIQFVVVDEVNKFRPITLSLRRVSAEAAIENMCKAAGAWAERNEAGIYLIRFGAAPGPTIATSTSLPPAPKELRKIRLLRTDPKEMFDRLRGEWFNDPNVASTQANNVDALTRRNNYQSMEQRAVTSEGITPFRASDIAARPQTNVSPEGANDITLPGEVANQLGGGGAGFPGGGGGGGLGGGIGGGGGGLGGGGGAGGGGGITLQGGQGLMPEGIDYLSYDPTDNSIVVRGTDEAIRQLQAAIALFDVAPKQVEIKVEFITTSQSVSRTFGMDWTFSRGAVFAGVTPGAFARTGDPVFVNYSTGNFVTRLRTQLLEGDGKVVSAPIVRTLNNQLGVVQQQSQTTIFVPTQTVTAGVITTTFNPVALNIGTVLAVRPRINNDGTIAMTLTPQIQQFGQIRAAPDGSQAIPDVLSSSIQIATRVRDGETILIAGFNSKQQNNTVNRIPILSDLPIFGSLFRSTIQNRNDSELLIFVTPKVIEEADDTSFNP